MKLKSWRKYKHDISDIIGIMIENSYLTYENIKKAYEYLYEPMDTEKQNQLQLFTNKTHDELIEIYDTISKNEQFLGNKIKYEKIVDENEIKQMIETELEDEIEL